MPLAPPRSGNCNRGRVPVYWSGRLEIHVAVTATADQRAARAIARIKSDLVVSAAIRPTVTAKVPLPLMSVEVFIEGAN